jgi:hypothetical protein
MSIFSLCIYPLAICADELVEATNIIRSQLLHKNRSGSKA